MEQNRREFVRIGDLLHVKYSHLSEADLVEEQDNLEFSTGANIIDARDLVLKWETPTEEIPKELENNYSVFKVLFDRIEHKLDLLFCHLVQERVDKGEFGTPRRCDISGGGIRFVCDEKFSVGESLKLEIFFPAFPPFVFRSIAEVVRVENNVNPQWGGKPFRVSVKYREFNDAERERVIQYIFSTQRVRLKDHNESPSD